MYLTYMHAQLLRRLVMDTMSKRHKKKPFVGYLNTIRCFKSHNIRGLYVWTFSYYLQTYHCVNTHVMCHTSEIAFKTILWDYLYNFQ